MREVEFLNQVGDPDEGELQFIMIVSDDHGHAEALMCPFNNYISIHKGSKLNPCEVGIAYPEKLIDGNLYVVLIAVDQDDGGVLADIGSEGLSSVLSLGLESAILAGLGIAAAEVTGPIIVGFLALDALIGFGGSKVQDYFENEDVIGSQSFALAEKYRWASGQEVSELSSNGMVRFSFFIDFSKTNEGLIVQADPNSYDIAPTVILPAGQTLQIADPEEFTRWYFTTLWQDRTYKTLWDNYLTSNFKSHASPGGYKEYTDWWGSVTKIEIHSIDVIENDGQSAWIHVKVTYFLSDGRTLQNREYDYDLTYNSIKNTWMFDYHY